MHPSMENVHERDFSTAAMLVACAVPYKASEKNPLASQGGCLVDETLSEGAIFVAFGLLVAIKIGSETYPRECFVVRVTCPPG